MKRHNKNKFARAVKVELFDRSESITSLAAKLQRPRETVSKAIHSQRFPLVRKAVAKHLNIVCPR